MSLIVSNSLIKYNVRIFTFVLLIIQSVGIHFFRGQSFFLGIVILCLSIPGLRNFKFKDFIIILFALIFLLINNVLISPSFDSKSFFYQSLIFLVSYLFLLQYKYKYDLSLEFFQAIKVLVYHALFGYFLFLILPQLFITRNINNMSYRTLGYLFYVSGNTFSGFSRNTGILWEPGILQLILNIYLFFNIRIKANLFPLFLGFIGVVSTFSTTGFIVLGINFIYFLYKNYNIKNLFYVLLLSIFVSFFFSLIQSNLQSKLDGSSESGLVRYRDFLIGIDLIKEKPIFGHGVLENDDLVEKSIVYDLESDLFSSKYLALNGEMSGGYTNGFFGLVVWYGIPIALLLYYLFLKNVIIRDTVFVKVLFSLMFFVTFFSEPITYTSFFIVFPFSSIILFNNK